MLILTWYILLIVVAATRFTEWLRKSDEKCCGNFQNEKSPKRSFFRHTLVFLVNLSALKPFRWNARGAEKEGIKSTERLIPSFSSRARCWLSHDKKLCTNYVHFFTMLLCAIKTAPRERYICFYIVPVVTETEFCLSQSLVTR